MDTIDENSIEEEFSTDPDVNITEEDSSLNEDEDPSKLKQLVNSPSKIDSINEEIILKSQSTVPSTAITPSEESVGGGDDLEANLGLKGKSFSPSPTRKLKITQDVSKSNNDSEIFKYVEYGNLREWEKIRTKSISFTLSCLQLIEDLFIHTNNKTSEILVV
jgi:hypothetical protein